MRKDDLRKLRALPATREMMAKGKTDIEKTIKHWWDSRPRKRTVPQYNILLRVQNLSGYIKIALFLPKDMRKNIKTPRYEIFLNVKGGEYITRELDNKGQEKRWLTAMVHNLTDTGYWGGWQENNQKVYLTNDGRRTLNRLKLSCAGEKKYKGIERLMQWQQEQKDEVTRRREAAEQAPWDADMKLIPRLPKDFEEWMCREAASHYYMIYEYDPKGQKIGYCSRCKKYVSITAPKHNENTKCPACRADVKFKAHSRLQTLSTGEYAAEIMQKFKGGIVVRTFEQKQWYRDKPYTDPNVWTHEYERILIFDDGQIRCYEWGSYKNKYPRWIFTGSSVTGGYFYGKEIKLYKRNFSRLKQNSRLKNSAIDLWDTLPLSTTRYLAAELGNPAIEMLAKIGMFRLAKDIIHEKYDNKLLLEDATEIAKMLKIDNSRLKRLKAMDGDVYSLRWMQKEKDMDTIWPDEMIKDFTEARFLPGASFKFLEVPLSFIKCHNYLKKQAALSGETIRQMRTTWEDYTNMAKKLKMDVKNDQIARPKDLKYAHDEAVVLSARGGLEKETKAIEKKFPKVNKQLPKLQKFEFTHGEYMIVAPKSVLDIVTEGTILRHCVHTCDYYFSRIQTDESYLFFLRKSKQPDMPWYTLEVEPSGNIRQKRTTGDNQNADFKEALPFLKKWQRHFKKQLTEEEKALGVKADELRKENYKNLRENGNKVWHGRLAGQLLADVLEADFMEAI